MGQVTVYTTSAIGHQFHRKQIVLNGVMGEPDYDVCLPETHFKHYLQDLTRIFLENTYGQINRAYSWATRLSENVDLTPEQKEVQRRWNTLAKKPAYTWDSGMGKLTNDERETQFMNTLKQHKLL